MSNMRQILKRGRPTLRMEVGGMVKPANGPVGLAEVTPQYTAAADAAHKANLADGASQLSKLQEMNGASSPTAAPTAPTAPVHDAAWGVKQGLATSLLNSFHPLPVPMKHGGRVQVMPGAEHGGAVPGTGQGDKVHTLLEPKEIVVSNAMQKKMPGLRESLMDLREQTLADQGMTVAEADAKARSGGTLRANTGSIIDPADLDLHNVAPGSQPMPAASVTADGIKLNRLRNAANAAAAAPANVSVPPVRPSVADQLRTLNQPGIDSRNVEYASHVDGELPKASNPFAAGEQQAQILKARAAGWTPGTPSGAEPKPVAPVAAAAPAPAAPNLLENVVTETPEAAPKPTGVNRIPGVQGVRKVAGSLRNAPAAYHDAAFNAGSKAASFVRANPATTMTALAAVPGQLNVSEVLTHPDSTASDVVQQQGHEVARLAMQGIGGLAGGTIGSAVGPWGTVAGGAGGAYIGGKAYDSFERGAKELLGTDARTPQERLREDAVAKPVVDPANQTEAYRKRTGLPLDKRVQANSNTDIRNHDFTGELNAVPKNLPQGLRDNVVYKTVDPKTGRVTYSGRNVGVNKNGETEMVDGMGRSSKMLNGNNTSFVRDDQTGKTAYGNSQGRVYDGTGAMKTGPAGDAEIRALHAAGLRGDTAALEGYYASKGQGFGGKSVEQIRAEQEEANAPKRGDFGFNHYTANKTALRAQDITKRGQDMELEGRLAPTRLAAMQAKQFQQIMGAAGKNGADPVALAVQSGAHMDVIKQIQAHQKEQQTIGDAQSKQMDDAFKNQFVRTDDKGNVHRDEQAEAIAAAQFRTLTGGRNLNPTELAAARNDAINHAKAVQGFQQTTRNRNDSFYKNWMPWTEKEAMPTALPENVSRSKVGWAEGAYTGHGLERGDWQVGDQELPATTDQGVLNYLDRVAKARKQLRD